MRSWTSRNHIPSYLVVNKKSSQLEVTQNFKILTECLKSLWHCNNTICSRENITLRED